MPEEDIRSRTEVIYRARHAEVNSSVQVNKKEHGLRSLIILSIFALSSILEMVVDSHFQS